MRPFTRSLILGAGLLFAGCSSLLSQKQMSCEVLTAEGDHTRVSPELSEFFNRIRYKLGKVMVLRKDISYGTAQVRCIRDEKGNKHYVLETAAHIIRDRDVIKITFRNADGTEQEIYLKESDFAVDTESDIAVAKVSDRLSERVVQGKVATEQEGTVLFAGFPLSSGYILTSIMVSHSQVVENENFMVFRVPVRLVLTPAGVVGMQGMSGGRINQSIDSIITNAIVIKDEEDEDEAVMAVLLGPSSKKHSVILRELLTKILKRKRQVRKKAVTRKSAWIYPWTEDEKDGSQNKHHDNLSGLKEY